MKIIKYETYYDSFLYVIRHPIMCFKNLRLVKKYPFLLPRDWEDKKPKHYHYQWTELDLIPDGWRKAFGNMMMDDLLIACKRDKVNPKEIRITETKEKYGQLRMSVNIYEPNIQRVLDDYEQVSTHICWKCGKLDVPIINFGWIIPECRNCYVKDSRTAKQYDEVERNMKTEDYMIPMYYTCHTFGENGSQYVNSDLTWITRRLRK